MNVKRLLRFYFSADKLNCALDNLIMRCACGSANSAAGGAACAERILELISAKRSLSLLWGYLNGVMQGFCEEDGELLLTYAYMRSGLTKLNKEDAKSFRRVTVRFSRRARNADRFTEGIRLVNSYYALLSRR
ncbi:MAG: hypothetical protein ACI4L9_01320 [Candidatus Coproplasma sp.]